MMKETKTAIRAAREAGKILMGHFGKSLKIRDKGKRGIMNLVTQADMESNRKIISILKKAFPDYGILSEEIPEEKGKVNCRWIIDPLDGTHNFTYGIPLFGVSIALEREGKVMLGVMGLPIFKQMFLSERGRGAFVNGKRIRVSRRGVKEAIVIFGVDEQNPDKTESIRIMNRLEENVFQTRRLGSAVVQFAYLAMGRADAYIDIGNKPWDNAAGFLTVEEAGGRVSGFSGRGWDINDTRFIASNGVIHEEILRIVKQ
jgi:myo-inositol-1(or 4)-monophosphatase